MKITVWGCRGSLPSPGAEKILYGGNTCSVQIEHNNSCIILDGGSGIQKLGAALDKNITTVNLLLTHLHLDHIMGLGFFQPFYNPHVTVNIWGPSGSNITLKNRLRRYFSPPIFPMRLNELPATINFYEINNSVFKIDDFLIQSEYICHPGPTLGYRCQAGESVIAYMPDHEPYLGSSHFPNLPEWTSGYNIAENVDILFHDAQYSNELYKNRVGWGHCSLDDAVKFASLCKVKRLVFFHHDPTHSDEELERLFNASIENNDLSYTLSPGKEGEVYYLP